jgi:hypothetical protein
MVTDFESTFTDKSCISMVGFDMTKACAEHVYKEAGLGPKDIQVIELHDCFSANEVHGHAASLIAFVFVLAGYFFAFMLPSIYLYWLSPLLAHPPAHYV